MAKLVYQRKNGKWEARFRKGTTSDGKPVYGTVYGDTEEEAIFRRIEHLGYDPDNINGAIEMNLLILGAGIHGHDVFEIAESLRIFKRISFLDDFKTGDDIIGKCSDVALFRKTFPCAFVAMGDNAQRKKHVEILKKERYLLPSLVSLSANISSKAIIGEGVAILPQSTVNEAVIGDFSIVDVKSTVNSGVQLGKYTRIDCGAIILRGAVVPEDTWLRSGEIFGDY